VKFTQGRGQEDDIALQLRASLHGTVGACETVNAVDTNGVKHKVRGLLPKHLQKNYDTHS
jgi:hypothetical protein